MKQVLLILVFILTFLVGCEKLFTTDVKYEVESSTPGFSVYYTTASGGEENDEVQGYSWSKEVAVDNDVKQVCLSVFPDSVSLHSSITVKIYIENKLELEDSGYVFLNRCVDL